MEFKNQDIKNTYDKFNEDTNSLPLKELTAKYLGRNSLVKELLAKIKNIPDDQKKEYGQQANELSRYIEEKLEQISNTPIFQGTKEYIDPTAPFDINQNNSSEVYPKGLEGTKNPLTQEMDRVLDIFKQMGFDIIESRQLDDDYHMFETLNIPKGHPARDIWDTFWTEEGLIPPAHTSTMQNRVMKTAGQPPVRCVIPGMCYRNEATDASHEHTLFQIEGVYVDKNISVGDMLGTIKTYLEAFFQTKLEIKVQPAYFPFTEPDMEFVISCPFCKKTGCKVCKYSGWMELMGCGEINPFVLREAGIDPEVYSGFAWGFGLDRLVMVKNGIQDVRRFRSGDLNFLKQF
ncbi:MAG: Phenylalanine-tRNA ligase [candidate division WS6 bacterium GW2011_GWF2_39_15]|uniref:phenylalanine--tRNA ligase n=1 Tax=candidate division WS6 bacterium GW2011_GWF2_39_15 TaxID=1619100 RepID=A0A0G0QX34_9BACT|nr:MAG: Phenylalanine-tRNA ligase [candidate division WS6 bacterium GW2011_GWF2_39_15]